MLKYYFVFLCFLASTIHAITSYSLVKFDNKKGWKKSYANVSNGKIDVTYNCTGDEKNNETSLHWQFEDLPANMQSLTIQNCKLNLKMGSTYDVRKNEDLKKMITKTKYEHFKKLVFKNILDLTIGPLLSGFQMLMNGNFSVSVEDVDNIRVLPSELITSVSETDMFYNKNMGGVHFSMRNVNIEEVETKTIDWKERDIPIELILKNVNVKRIKRGAIRMHDYSVQYPLGKINSYPESTVNITNCTFGKLPTNVIMGVTKNFVFTNNKVDEIESSAMNITFQNATLSRNQFNHVYEHAFSSMSKGKNASLTFNSNVIYASEENTIYFGKYDSVDANDNTTSIHQNKFRCINSSWLLEMRNETRNGSIIHNHNVKNISVISKHEQILLKNIDNVCIDDEFKNSSIPVQHFYIKYPIYHDSWKLYIPKPGSPISPYTFLLIIVATLVIIALMGLYLYKRKK